MISKLTYMQMFTLGVVVFSCLVYAQDPPADLLIRASAGGVEPGAVVASVQIDAMGNGLYTKYSPERIGEPPLQQVAFVLNGNAMRAVWRDINNSDFFTLDAYYQNEEVGARTFASLRINANGDMNEVTAENTPVDALDDIIYRINIETADSLNLRYRTSGTPQVYVSDPCSGLPPNFKISADATRSIKGRPNTQTKFPDYILQCGNLTTDTAHPGTAVHTNMPIAEGVQKGIITLKAKGGYFGDNVEMTVDNTGTPQPDDEVEISLYMDFYGEEATEEIVERIEDAIEDRWSMEDIEMDDGRKVDVKTTVYSNVEPGEYFAPGTPGYHQIELVKEGTSNVGGHGLCFDVNEGTGWGTWRTTGEKLDEMYAHEAGHFLGLEDRYSKFNKIGPTDDFAWREDGTVSLISNEEMAQKLADGFADLSYEDALNWLEDSEWLDRVTAPSEPGFIGDLMSNHDGDVNLNDLRNLINKAGLLVHVEPGETFVPEDEDKQNFASTTPTQMFVPPGEMRTIEGVNVACIDADKGIPHPGEPLDLGLKLSDWRGVPAADMLLTLINEASDRNDYCKTALNLGIWRITDNILVTNPELKDWMAERGVDIGDDYLEFPRMTNSNEDDSLTTVVLPPELFVTSLSPKSRLVQAGEKIEIEWEMASPASVEVENTSFSWTLEKPENSASEIAEPENIMSEFEPDLRGFYHPTLNLSVSAADWPDANIVAKSRVVVADDHTETFERDTLYAAEFPWTTSGDTVWALSEINPHSGNYSARSGQISDFDTTRMKISADFSEPGELAFAFRLHCADGGAFFRFSIDGVEQAEWTGYIDWETVRFPVGAGKHVFTWSFRKSLFGGSLADGVWIDDIFFPETAQPVHVAKSEETPTMPTEYSLSQNYPNPFNPVTTISYTLLLKQDVSLIVYDQLGKEVVRLVESVQAAGHHQAEFDGTQLPSGTYYYTLKTGQFSNTRKMILLK